MRRVPFVLIVFMCVLLLHGCRNTGAPPDKLETLTPTKSLDEMVTTPNLISSSTPSPIPPSITPSIITGGTEAAPTHNPSYTPYPWLGEVLPLSDIKGLMVGKPIDIAIAADSSVYLTDIQLNRILHLDLSGNILGQWGSFAASDQSQTAPEGTFNEPWGIALAPDGSVFVADTWNHRIQVFTPMGEFIRSWGVPGQGNEPYGFFGPRDVVIGKDGFVFVSDTGNKRIVVFRLDGEYVSQIGGEGDQPGQFIEPVGIALSQDGDLYVADQGNQRVQVFAVDGEGNLTPKLAWKVDAWQHLDILYKPYLCVVGSGVFLTDTEAGIVLEYGADGEPRASYDLAATGFLNYGLLYGIAAQEEGIIWVVDITGGAPALVKIIPGT